MDVKGRFYFTRSKGLAKICSISIEKTLNKGDCFNDSGYSGSLPILAAFQGKTLLPIDGLMVKVMQQVQKSVGIK